jgi:DNA-directed RNA polymerase
LRKAANRLPMENIDQSSEQSGGVLPEELLRASDKFERRQQAIANAEGAGSTEGAQATTRKHIAAFADALRSTLGARKTQSVYREFLAVIRRLDAEVLALCILHGVQHSIGQRENYRDTALRIGQLLADECWAKGLTEDDPGLARRIERQVRRKAASSEHRKKYARTLASRTGYKTKDWNNELLLRAGEWALLVLLQHLPDVFMIEDGPREDDNEGEDKFLTLTAAALAYADDAVAQLILRNPVWLPRPEAPKPWTGWNDGAVWDKRLARSVSVMRAHQKHTKEAVEQAIRDGTMKPALDALNALQGVPWTINKRVLEVIRECAARGISAPGLPAAVPMPEEDKPRDNLSEEEHTAWKIEQGELRKAKRRFNSDRTLFTEDVQAAEMLAEHGRFWTPMNMDWRGRVYGLPSFAFHREDRVRALFLFADGEPIGAEGLYWLKVHVANCGDFDRLRKRTFQDRVAWVDQNFSRITAVASAPLSELWWTEADAPFKFLAACFELASAVAEGPTFVTRLPISFDGSCNGLQHLCAMTRAEEGGLVNLTPESVPQDIYQTVADQVKERIERDLENEEKRHLAQMCLDWIWDASAPSRPRKTFKRNVMTYAYSSKVFGMAGQLREDTMEPLSIRVLRKELEEHPFGRDRGFAASWYLAQHSYAAIEQVVKSPAAAMDFLQKLARVLADKGKHLHWTSPAGVPWINRYNKKDTKRVHLWLHDRGVRVPHTVKLAMRELPEIDKNDVVNAVAPNFVHACDAAHLLRTVNAAVSEGITSIATVHDSFGCLPPRAARFREIIWEEFVGMYREHDVLQEVLNQARADWGAVRLLSHSRPEGQASKSSVKS